MAPILIVDDQQPMRQLMRMWLEDNGHQVTEAGNGLEAIRIFDETKPELVITDIFMPEKEGLGLIRTLRKRSAVLKIIAISGGPAGDMGDFLITAQMLGAVAALQKPFSRSEFMELVFRVLQGSSVY